MDSDGDLDQEMQQGGGEPTIISLEELRALVIKQQSLEDQTDRLTTTQAGFPVTSDTKEFQNDRTPPTLRT